MIKINNQNLISRPPVVVILGHVDHGKTSILDYIRKTKVVEKESGGITQHIGAYQVEEKGKKITFIDTPGHEAFSAMRLRGAKVADIAVLVIDSCEGVKSQTKEAILAVKEAKIPMIVALNKIDRIEADPERVKRELSKEDVLVESMGGKTPLIKISAKTGQGISELLELILLVAEMEDFQTDISESAEGVVIESYLDNLVGPIATLILNKGILKIGDIIATSSSIGKVKNLENFQGLIVQTVEPSAPVKVFGFENVPTIGDTFKVFSSLEEVKNYLSKMGGLENKPICHSPEVKLMTGGKVLNLILKTDCLGSTEAIEGILNKLPQEKVVLRILKSENGEVNETDIKLAKACNALVLVFRVKINQIAQSLIERERVKIIQFQVIYEMVEKIRSFMEKLLEPETTRTNLGKLKVLVNFIIKGSRQVVGGKMIEGEIKKGVLIEVIRNEELIGKGRLINLQRNKRDIDRASKGEDCGILYEGNVNIEEGDILIIYTEGKRKGEL